MCIILRGMKSWRTLRLRGSLRLSCIISLSRLLSLPLRRATGLRSCYRWGGFRELGLGICFGFGSVINNSHLFGRGVASGSALWRHGGSRLF